MQGSVSALCGNRPPEQLPQLAAVCELPGYYVAVSLMFTG